MTTLAWLAAGWLAAFFVNVSPALMPPMWAVLAAFALGAEVPLIPLGIGAAVAGAAGRLVLARASRAARPALGEGRRQNAEALGHWFERRGWRKWLLVAGYIVGPFPSNALFIAAGAGRVPAFRMAVIFALCRAVTDTFWAWIAVRAAEGARGLLVGSMTGWEAIAGQVLAVVLVVLFVLLPWARWVGIGPHDE